MRHALVFVLSGCMGAGAVELGGEPWPLTDDLFHQDPHWLGGDIGATIDLADGRTLWLFGDSFIATSANRTRRESRLVANSIAVMSGRDPATATLDFEWQGGLAPGAYFPDAGDHRLRPMSGVRLAGTDADGRGGPLVIFLAELDHVGGVVGTRA
ncbi:MAG TPA: hypothetical protein VIU61_24230, partial [Kofleriaceae bacterium]